MEKSSIQEEQRSLHQHIGLKFKEETSKVLNLEHTSFVWRWNLDTAEGASVLLKCGAGEGWKNISWTDHVRKEELQIVKEERNNIQTIKRGKANWIGHSLRRNCHLKHFIEEQIAGRIEVTGRRRRRHRQLLDNLKEKTGHWKLKEEALDRTVWRTSFGRGYGPVVRQTAEWLLKS